MAYMSANTLRLHRFSRVGLAALGLVLLAGLTAPPISAQPGGHRARMSSELAQKLAAPDQGTQLRVILTAPQDEVDRLAQKYSLTIARRMFSGAVFEGTVSSIDALATDPNVSYVEEDRKTFSTMAVTTQATGADQVWQGSDGSSFGGITGKGVVIAVLDSGIDSHEDVSNRLLASFDFTDPKGRVKRGGDDD